MNEELILEGSLEKISLPDVMTFISLLNKTGRLELHTHDGIEKTIYWKKGEVVFATSTSLEDSLGVFLLKNGKITREQYETSLKMLHPGVKHGKLLVRLGYLSPQDLWWAVKNQVMEIIYSCFSIKEGRFLFYELPETAIRQRILLSTPTTSLIMEGIRRLDEWARIKEKIPSPSMTFYRQTIAKEAMERLKLSPLELNVLELIKPDKTVEDIIRISGLSEFQVYRILLTLLHAHLIWPVQAKGEEEKEEEAGGQNIQALVEGYSMIFQDLFNQMANATSPPASIAHFNQVLKEVCGKMELFEGVVFGEKGTLNIQELLANAAELPPQRRLEILDDALNTLLGYLLFEVAQKIDIEEKKRLYKDVSERKAALDRLTEDLSIRT